MGNAEINGFLSINGNRLINNYFPVSMYCYLNLLKLTIKLQRNIKYNKLK